MDFEKLSKTDPEQMIRIKAGDMVEVMAGCIQTLVEDCMEMAEKNWTPGQYQQLEWLVGAVLEGKEYAAYAEEHKNERNIFNS